jgi:hypothetical protein
MLDQTLVINLISVTQRADSACHGFLSPAHGRARDAPPAAPPILGYLRRPGESVTAVDVACPSAAAPAAADVEGDWP